MNKDYLKEKLIKCKGVSFDEVNIDELDDITKINFSKKSNSNEKIIDFIKSAKNPYMFKCNGRKIAFSNNYEIAENKLKDTVNKIYK